MRYFTSFFSHAVFKIQCAIYINSTYEFRQAVCDLWPLYWALGSVGLRWVERESEYE